jgi:hypothetical protein
MGFCGPSSFLSEIVSGARPKGGAIKEGIPSIGAENIIILGFMIIQKRNIFQLISSMN